MVVETMDGVHSLVDQLFLKHSFCNLLHEDPRTPLLARFGGILKEIFEQPLATTCVNVGCMSVLTQEEDEME
jgi:hypothetical protein